MFTLSVWPAAVFRSRWREIRVGPAGLFVEPWGERNVERSARKFGPVLAGRGGGACLGVQGVAGHVQYAEGVPWFVNPVGQGDCRRVPVESSWLS